MSSKERKLAIDLRELRRSDTGIGRWIKNFLNAKSKLAPFIHVIGVGGYTDGIDTALNAPKLFWSGFNLNKILKKEDAKLWFSPYFKIPPGLSIPCYATVHDTIPASIPHRCIPFTLKLKWSLSVSKKIVTVSDATKNELIEKWKVPCGRIIMAKNAVGRHFTANNTQNENNLLTSLGLELKKYFLVVSDDRPHKNLSTLISAFEGFEMIPIILVGTKRKNLPTPFRRLEVFDDQMLAALYRNARALLHPALAEGFGLPALEAMACGCPVILSDIPSLREVGGDCARYVPATDIEAWRNAVLDSPTAEGTIERASMFRPETTYSELWQEIKKELEQ